MFDLFYCFDLGNGASDICQFHRKLEENILQFMHNLLIAWQKLEITNQKEKEDLMISKKQKRMIRAIE